MVDIDVANIADTLDEELLLKIGEECFKGYEDDVGSRKDWELQLEEWTKLAIQVKEEKSYPWPKASNVKYPLLSTAAMQFAARAYPIIVPSDGKPVKCRVIGSDQNGAKAGRAKRISEHLSFQVMEEMDGWEEDTDRLLMILAVAGTVFRKTYYDPVDEKVCSKLVLPRDLVVNYWSRSLEQSFRKTQRLYFTKNDIIERKNKGLYLDIDLPNPTVDGQNTKEHPNRNLYSGEDDATVPYLILEQHTWLDLDDDGYKEPYVVTFEYKSRKVLRIVARYSKNDIELSKEGKIIRIKAKEYFTKFGFIPNPDGGFYDLGFGALLGALNESANTIVNQLIDAGSLSNLQSGFIAKGLRVKLGDSRFQPGEWKTVNAVGEDLKKGVLPLPTAAPSNVLFELLGMIVQSTKELASVAEIFVGKIPGQNTPATTTQATIEQGMKVFTSIFKRIYRALTTEFRKIYVLNKETLDPQKYQDVLDDPASQQDYQGSENDIVPSADPQAQTDSMKQQKAQAILQAVQYGLDPMASAMRFLEANSVEDIQNLLPKEPPPPPPEVQKMQMQMQMDEQKHQLEMQSKQLELQIEQQKAQIEMEVEQAKLEIEKAKLQIEEIKLQFEAQKMQLEHQFKQQEMLQGAQFEQHKMGMEQEKHSQKMEMDKEKAVFQHEQALKKQKESNNKEE